MANGKLSFLSDEEVEGIKTMPQDAPPPQTAPGAGSLAPEQQVLANLFASLEQDPAPSPPKMSVARGIAGALSDALYVRARVLAGGAPTIGPFAAQQMQGQRDFEERQALYGQQQRDLRNKIRFIQAQNNLEQLQSIRDDEREAVRDRDEFEYEQRQRLKAEQTKADYERQIDERTWIIRRAADMARFGVLPPGTDITKLTMNDIVRMEGLVANGQDDAIANLVATVQKIDPDMQLVSVTPTADGRLLPQFGRRQPAASKPMSAAQRISIFRSGVLPTHPDGTPKTDPELEEEFAAVQKAEMERKAKDREIKLNKPTGRGAFTVKDKMVEQVKMLLDAEEVLSILEAYPEGIGGPGLGYVPQWLASEGRQKLEPPMTRLRNIEYKLRSGAAVTAPEEARMIGEFPQMSDTQSFKLSKTKDLVKSIGAMIAGSKTAHGLSDEDVQSIYDSMKNAGFVPSPPEEGDVVIGD